jgi:hypothetical protein
VPTGATTGTLVVTVGGVASNGVAFTVVTTPLISDTNPSFGGVGAAVTILGSNFGATQGNSTVSLNGTTLTPSSWSDLAVTFVVPSSAATGPIVVTVGGNASNAVTFSVLPAPEITNLLPPQGLAGTSVLVTGSNFGSSQGSSVVTFNGVAATPSSWSNTGITVPVPAGTTTGPVAVTVASAQSNGVVFLITGPAITGLSTHIGAIGDSITIYGAGFGSAQGSNTITFNGVPATATSWNGMTIVAPVPTGASSGSVTVTVAGTASNSVSFTVSAADTITGLTISSPSDGATVSTPYAAVTGTVSGSIAGVDPIVVTCNSVAAQLTGTNFSCNPPLTTGVNPITVTGTDSAGDTSSATINVTLGMATPVSLTVTPGPVNMLVSQTQSFTAVDSQGMKRPDATWTVSDSTVANLVTGSPNTLMADAVGQVTLTATVGGVSGQTTVTVLAGTSLPIGTVLWSATPSGCAAQQIVQAVPTANGPDLYSIETCSDGSTLVRAFASDGEQLWQSSISQPAGFTFLAGAGDNAGGLLLSGEANSSEGENSYLIDLEPQAGKMNWQYTPASVTTEPPVLDTNIAVGSDGSIFAVDHGCEFNHGSTDCLNAINPQTGALVNQISLPTSNSINTNDNYCDEPVLSTTMTTYAGPSSAPMITSDGSLYLEVSAYNSFLYEVCNRNDGVPNVTSQSSGLITLVRVLPDGGTQLQQIDGSSTQNQPTDIPNDVIPDGNGGVLATYGGYTQPMEVSDVGPGGAGTATIPNVFMFGAPISTSMVLGDNATAFVTDGYDLAAFSTTTLQPLWTYTSTGGSLSFVAAISGGGVTINDSSQGVIQLDSSGNPSTPVASLQGTQYFSNALWVGETGDPVLAEFQGNFLVWAPVAFAAPLGNAELQRSPRLDFGLVWCLNGICGQQVDQNNDQVQNLVFTIAANNAPQSSFIILSPSQIDLIQKNAANAFRVAYSNFNVTIDTTGRQAAHTAYVAGESLPFCGWTPTLNIARSLVYFPKHAVEAQDAVNDDSGTPTSELLGAIGEGVGNSAAHEIAHQLVGQYSGLVVNGMDLDDDSLGTYNGIDCSGTTNPAWYTGSGIHWSQDAITSLMNIFGTRN